MATKFTQTTGVHLTSVDRMLIKASIENGNQPVGTKQKKLQIVEVNGNEVKAVLHSFEVGIGIGSKKSWVGRKVEYTINKIG